MKNVVVVTDEDDNAPDTLVGEPDEAADEVVMLC